MYGGMGAAGDTVTTLPDLTGGPSSQTVSTTDYGSFTGSDVQNILTTLNQEITDKTTAQSTSKYLTYALLGVGGVFLLMALAGGRR